MSFQRKDLLGMEDLSSEEIIFILDTAKSFREILERPIKMVPTLRGKTVANLFFEPSTRTRLSFELAEKRLNAAVLSFSSLGSSVAKGETLLDTAKNILAMKVDCFVLRHTSPGTPHLLARELDVSVINAGDGAHEHPTQALLDLYTIRERKGRVEGLKMAIVGDISHSRVARSNIWGMVKLGAEVRICGPPTLIPPDIERMGAKVFYSPEKALQGVDVVMMLRIQKERQTRGLVPSVNEYKEFFSLTEERLDLARKDALVMHPGPVNRGVELPARIADGERSIILDQVTNGVAVRMAILYLLLGKRRQARVK
ncbi:aspartate carbamoyltransferase catalytic subunit [Candidatus Aerophobetes bacterium]|uniref:Aspartate carbamoyltransferase n=1 Tax=Aerophobetes bacterium TaxID=2030807 RepID=A0A523QGG3_UNCAE|nr:MAG: aspartate carbamoyltransferase catalytic subunit [Candidatus Aerophobetes bacterium]